MTTIFRRVAATAVLTGVPVVMALGTAAVSQAATGTTSGSDNVAVGTPQHVAPPSSFAPRPMTPWQPRHHHRHHRNW